ncbi:AraC family transcriptional regulator [Luteibacter sp. Sphag1AF]|uniref:helix-turn-helix domain-containing protein n=1 Tax=Luteibacter sp. Sphag1AF TaxID=2587031 RepID=UPI001619B85A|nr:AraC family transcriptional regulator [Luteibacter sp. Sphag1AF]MBB3226331.1 AraC family transcriptional regulator [Luteibacter sp. Sphag1AF]
MGGISQLHVSGYAPRSIMDAHEHDEAWLCLVLEGSYEERIRSRTHEHRAGDLLYCPELTTHQQSFGDDGARKVLFAPDDSLQDVLSEGGVRLADAPFVRGSRPLLALGHRLATELELADPFSQMAAQGIALELIATWARARREARREPPVWLRRLRDVLHEDPSAALSQEAWAAVAGRHPVHVSRAFRAAYGVPMGEYVRQLRVESAARLLRETRQSVLDIALGCGFTGAAQFSRSFRAVMGCSPSQFRASSR